MPGREPVLGHRDEVAARGQVRVEFREDRPASRTAIPRRGSRSPRGPEGRPPALAPVQVDRERRVAALGVGELADLTCGSGTPAKRLRGSSGRGRGGASASARGRCTRLTEPLLQVLRQHVRHRERPHERRQEARGRDGAERSAHAGPSRSGAIPARAAAMARAPTSARTPPAPVTASQARYVGAGSTTSSAAARSAAAAASRSQPPTFTASGVFENGADSANALLSGQLAPSVHHRRRGSPP